MSVPRLALGQSQWSMVNFIVEAGMRQRRVSQTSNGDSKHPVLTVRSWSGIESEVTGFFRTEERDGVWWLIDPEGKGFYVIGTDHANFKGHFCEKLGYAPYNSACTERYGAIEPWAETTVARLLKWGFNSLGWGHSPELRHRGLAHTEWLDLGTNYAKLDDISPQTTWTGFPNVFSPHFGRFCDERARSLSKHKEDPWLVGHFIDNELEWYGKTRRETGLLDDTMKKGPDHPAKMKLVEFLGERYGKVGRLNTSWGLSLGSFEDLLSLTQMPPVTQAMEQDSQKFLQMIAERYFSVTTSAIRKHDPNHLVLGCRFAGRAPGPAWQMAGRYCEVVSVNCYRKLDLAKGTMADGFEGDLRNWYSLTGKPLMITEWSFPALDAGLPCSHGGGQRVATQKDRAQAFTVFQTLLFRTPFIVGSNFFMWVDEPALGISSSFPEDSNYGLVNEKDEPYVELTEAASELNPRVYCFRLGATGSVERRSKKT